MKKLLFSLVLSISIVVNSFLPQIVYANAYVPVLATAAMGATASAMATAIAPFAIPIALIGVVCISGGIIFHNEKK